MSKGLEELKDLEDYYIEKSDIITVYVGDTEQCDIIEKELKALEIIKNKHQLNFDIIKYSKDFYEYFDFDIFKNNDCDRLTQKEYELLKEVLL